MAMSEYLQLIRTRIGQIFRLMNGLVDVCKISMLCGLEFMVLLSIVQCDVIAALITDENVRMFYREFVE